MAVGALQGLRTSGLSQVSINPFTCHRGVMGVFPYNLEDEDLCCYSHRKWQQRYLRLLVSTRSMDCSLPLKRQFFSFSFCTNSLRMCQTFSHMKTLISVSFCILLPIVQTFWLVLGKGLSAQWFASQTASSFSRECQSPWVRVFCLCTRQGTLSSVIAILPLYITVSNSTKQSPGTLARGFALGE